MRHPLTRAGLTYCWWMMGIFEAFSVSSLPIVTGGKWDTVFLFLPLSPWQQGRKRMALSSLGGRDSTCLILVVKETAALLSPDRIPKRCAVTGWRQRTLGYCVWEISEISTWYYLGDTGGLNTFMATLWRYSLPFQLASEWDRGGSHSSSSGMRWDYLHLLPFTFALFLRVVATQIWSVLKWSFSYLVLLVLPDFHVHHARYKFAIILLFESCGL